MTVVELTNDAVFVHLHNGPVRQQLLEVERFEAKIIGEFEFKLVIVGFAGVVRRLSR